MAAMKIATKIRYFTVTNKIFLLKLAKVERMTYFCSEIHREGKLITLYIKNNNGNIR